MSRGVYSTAQFSLIQNANINMKNEQTESLPEPDEFWRKNFHN